MLKEIYNAGKKIVLPVASSFLLQLPINGFAEDMMRKALILDFQDKSVLSENTSGLKSQLPDLLENRLNKTFNILKRSEVSRALNDFELDNSDVDKIKEKYPDLDYVVSGSYGVINSKDLVVNSEIVDLRTLKRADQHYEGSIEDLFGAVNKVVNEMRGDLGYATQEGAETEAVQKVKKESTVKELQWSFMPFVEFPFIVSPGDFKDYHKGAMNLGVEIRKHKGEKIGITFPSIAYSAYTFDFEKVMEEYGITKEDFTRLEGGSVKFLNIGTGVTYYVSPKSKTIPFFGLGVGYSHGSEDPVSVTVGTQTTIPYKGSEGDGWYVSANGGVEQVIGGNLSARVFGRYEYLNVGTAFKFIHLGGGINIEF